MQTSRSAHGNLKIPQGKLQSAVFGMIVVPDGEGDIDAVAGEKRGLLQALGHVPTQGIKDDFGSQFSALSSRLIAARVAFGYGCNLFNPTDGGTVGMAARSYQNGKGGEFLRFNPGRRGEQRFFGGNLFVSNRGRPELQLDVFIFQNPRRRG